ncbi:hypothetical protein GQ457_17G002650 [Hibiscus cannabinus]
MNQESGYRNQETGIMKNTLAEYFSGKQAYSIRRKHSFRNTFQKSGCSTGRIHTSKADQGSLLCTSLPTLYGGARAYTRMEQGNNRSAYGNRVGRAGLSG